eukprot:2269569-Pleurochrysis_carterae.AAC.1
MAGGHAAGWKGRFPARMRSQRCVLRQRSFQHAAYFETTPVQRQPTLTRSASESSSPRSQRARC